VLREEPDIDPKDTGDVTVLNLQGELYFAAAEELSAELTRQLDGNTRFLVLRVQEAFNADATTVEAIASVAEKARRAAAGSSSAACARACTASSSARACSRRSAGLDLRSAA
jgi:MFS superfamily sulfate permease-like transporter